MPCLSLSAGLMLLDAWHTSDEYSSVLNVNKKYYFASALTQDMKSYSFWSETDGQTYECNLMYLLPLGVDH